MLTTERILTDVLVSLFGHRTLDMKLFRGKDLRDPGFPRTYFLSDRIGKHPEKPINRRAADRVLLLVDIVLRGQSKLQPATASRMVRSFILDDFGVDTREFVLRGPNDPNAATKIEAQLALLRCILVPAINVEALDEEEIAGALRMERFKLLDEAGWAEAMGDPSEGYEYGVDDFYFRVEDAGYAGLIDGVERNLDVMHFHGLTWTNSNREFLRHCLSRPEVEARVVLLDPESEFFGAFARYIRYDERKLRDKLYDAVDVWKTVASEAGGASGGAWLRIYLADFFPAKSIYRFDSMIMVTPRTNARPKDQFASFGCSDVGEEGAYAVYLAELESVIAEGRMFWDSHNPS